MDENALLPFQREGVGRGYESFRGRVLLADEMGLGKTVQAIAIACRYRHEWPLLVIAPTSMCLPWCEELERWCPFLRPGDINLVKSHHNGALRVAPVTVLSFGLVTNGKDKEVLMAAIRSASFSCVIADEAHYLKNKDAVRTQLVLPVLARARRCILCTGTPALSRPVELYPLLCTLRPDVPQFGGGYTRFVERYCAAQRIPLRGGASRFDVSGCSNAVELHDLLVRHCMVRRLKADVLTELPPKRRQRVLLSLGVGSGGARSGGAGRSKGAVVSAIAELAELQKQMDATPVSDEKRRRALLASMCVTLASAKAAHASDYCLELLPQCANGKLLFFAHH